MFNFIKQLEEKNVANDIDHMVWSDRMDLVAFSNIKGEVALHRLTWTRAWVLSPPQENLAVKGLVWRPDGKILAVAYISGDVLLIGIENKTVLNVSSTQGDITCLSWLQEKREPKPKDLFLHKNDDEEEHNDYMKNIDFSAFYLPETSPVSFDQTSNTDENQLPNFLHTQTEFNLLLIGTNEGLVHIRIFGCFTCAILNINEYVGYKCSVQHIHLTEDLSKLFVTVKDEGNNVNIVVIDSNILKTHIKELYAIALKYIKIMDLVLYLSNTITSITETWESIFLEIDNKLSKYAGKVAKGGVTADFLDLLLFGLCSNEMEEFLVVDLTKKGLEKFGQTIEMSYINIQKLILNNIIKFGQNLTFHLAELRGMSRYEYRYGVIGLSESNITDAILSNGSFLIKAGEMQQILNHSLANYRAFFRWLYTAIMHSMEEQTSSDIHKMTQQDIAYITDFLQNFDNIGGKNEPGSSGFKMERLGQYLNDTPLSIEPNLDGNDWALFLSENSCLENHPNIIKHFKNMSLIQQFKHLRTATEKILNNPKDMIGQQFKPFRVLSGFNFGETSLNMSCINLNKDVLMYSFISPKENMFLLQINVNNCNLRAGKLRFSSFTNEENISDNYEIVDAKFFSQNILSVLLKDSILRAGILYQFCIGDVMEKLADIDNKENIEKCMAYPDLNGTLLSPKMYKIIDGMVSSKFAVSGSRRVGIVLAENRRKIRLFELGGEEEEEDDDGDVTNSIIKDSDYSMQESSVME